MSIGDTCAQGDFLSSLLLSEVHLGCPESGFPISSGASALTSHIDACSCLPRHKCRHRAGSQKCFSVLSHKHSQLPLNHVRSQVRFPLLALRRPGAALGHSDDRACGLSSHEGLMSWEAVLSQRQLVSETSVSWAGMQCGYLVGESCLLGDLDRNNIIVGCCNW